MNSLNPGTAALSLGAALLCVAAAASGCTSEGGGRTGGTGGTSTTGGTGGTGGTGMIPTSGVTGHGLCGMANYPCCEGSCTEVGVVCVDYACVLSVPFGGACTKNEECDSRLCLESGHCSRSCASAADCPPAPEWTCASLASYPEDMCQCMPSGPEVCDGEDNDCDGVVDDGVTCSEAGFYCQSGVCACNPAALCNGVCEDIASDLQNCGACGTTCAVGAACFEGHCQTTLVSGQSPVSIAVDATHLYWTSNDGGVNNAVMKVPLGGGAPITLASGLIYPHYLALGASHVYWTDVDWKSDGASGTVRSVLLGGGAPTTLATGQNFPSGIAVDATSVYWTTASVMPSAVMKVPLGGGAITGFVSGQQSTIENIAVDATGIYMVGHGSIVTKVPLAGGNPITLAPYEFSKAASTNHVTVDATHVYWTTDDAVMKVPVAGGVPIVLASGQYFPGGIVVDAANVYWTNGFSEGTVMKVPINGGARTTLASEQIAPGAIAVDATSVYWTAGSSLKKAPK